MSNTSRPMPSLIFDGMALTFRIRDMIHPPHKVLAFAEIQPGMTVVDYGCGPGSYTMAAAKLTGLSGSVYGVDIHPRAIQTVNRKAARQHLTQVKGIHVSDYDTGIEANSADRVLLMDMIHMVPDQSALLREVRRILKPDGLAFVQIHHTAPEPIKQALAENGFQIVTADGENLLAAQA